MGDEILDAFTHDHVRKQLQSALEYGTTELDVSNSQAVWGVVVQESN